MLSSAEKHSAARDFVVTLKGLRLMKVRSTATQPKRSHNGSRLRQTCVCVKQQAPCSSVQPHRCDGSSYRRSRDEEILVKVAE